LEVVAAVADVARTGLDPFATPASVRVLDTGEGAAGELPTGKLPDGVAISIGSLA